MLNHREVKSRHDQQSPDSVDSKGISAPGYRSVAVEAAMTVDTSEFTCGKDGVLMWRLSTAILHQQMSPSAST